MLVGVMIGLQPKCFGLDALSEDQLRGSIYGMPPDAGHCLPAEKRFTATLDSELTNIDPKLRQRLEKANTSMKGIVKSVPFAYPMESRSKGEQGLVVGVVHVDENGDPTGVEILYGQYEQLNTEFRSKLMQYKFISTGKQQEYLQPALFSINYNLYLPCE